MYSASDRKELLKENGLTHFNEYTVQRYNLNDLMKEHVNADVPTVTTNFITLQLNKVLYRYSSKETPEMLWMFRGFTFNSSDVRELRTRFGIDSPYIGSLPKDGTNEALVSEALLEKYGLKADDVMGKQLSIILGENVTPIDQHITVTGVIVEQFYELSGHRKSKTQIVPTVVLAQRNLSLLTKIDVLYVYEFTEWQNLSAGELSDICSEGDLVYCGLSSYNQRAFLDNIKTVVVNVFYVVGSMLTVGLLLTVMLTIDKFVTVFSRICGILLSCGLDPRNMYRLLLAQILLLFLLALPVALVGALVGYAVIVELMAIGTGMSMTVSTMTLVLLLALAFVAVLLAALAFFGFAALRVRKLSVKGMLTAEQS